MKQLNQLHQHPSNQVQSIKDVIKAAIEKFPTLSNKQMGLIITGAVFGMGEMKQLKRK